MIICRYPYNFKRSFVLYFKYKNNRLEDLKEGKN